MYHAPRRVRHVFENAFGILASRFGVFRTPIALAPQKVIVLAACALHNYLRDQSVSTNVGDVEDAVTHDTIPGA